LRDFPANNDKLTVSIANTFVASKNVGYRFVCSFCFCDIPTNTLAAKMLEFDQEGMAWKESFNRLREIGLKGIDSGAGRMISGF